jgi:hypothetical protein
MKNILSKVKRPWTALLRRYMKGIGPLSERCVQMANGKWQRTVDRYPPTVDQGPWTSFALRCNKCTGPCSKGQGPWTFDLAPKDWVLLLAAYDGLSGGRIRPNSTMLDGRAPNEYPCSNDECCLMCPITAMAKITVLPGLRA